MRRKMTIVLLLLLVCAGRTAHAGLYDEFVTLDPETKYFRNADGLFCGFGMNYNQIIDDKMFHAPSMYDLEVMASDLRKLKRMGFTHLSLRMNWGVVTRKETKADALANWDKLLDLVEEHGLYVEIWFDPLNSWPAEVPGQQRRETIIRERNWQLYLDCVGEMVGRFKDRKSILGWRSENESLPVSAQARYDNLPELLAPFREAVKAHYGTIAKVNEAWDTSYSTFDDMTLPGKDEEGSGRLIDYNVLFHEPFIIERNREFERVFHKNNPNHILIVSGIGAVGGRVGFLFEVHDIDKLEGFDICGNGLYGRFPPQGAGSLLHYHRTIRKFLSLGKPAMITEVGIEVGGEKALTRSYQRDWILTNFADAVGAGGTAMDIWAYTSVTEADGNYRSTDNVTCQGLSEFIHGVAGAVFPQESPEVLILKTKGEDYGYWPWRCHGNAMMLADILYQMHIPCDFMTDANVTAERLEKYSFIFVPSQSVLIDEPVWRMINTWVRREPNRALALGKFAPTSALVKPAQIPVTMASLIGQPPTVAVEGIDIDESQTLTFDFQKHFGRFRPGDRLDFNYGGADSIWDMPRQWPESMQVVATLDGAGDGTTPLLVEDTLPNGSKVYIMGFRLGLVTWSLGMDALQPTFDNMVPLYGEMLKRAGVTAQYDAPHNIGVYMSRDNDVVIVKERMGIATEEILRSERLGSSLFIGATVTLTEGQPPTLSADLPPRGVRVFRRAPVSIVGHSGSISVRCMECEPRIVAIEVTSASPVRLALSQLEPAARYQLTTVVAGTHRQSAGIVESTEEGTLVLELSASEAKFVRLEFIK